MFLAMSAPPPPLRPWATVRTVLSGKPTMLQSPPPPPEPEESKSIQVETKTCGICFDDVPLKDVVSTLCADEGCLSASQHACAECLKQHFEGMVLSGFDGACPPLTCAFHPKRLVPARVWSKLVASEVVKKVAARAHATLSLQCSGCHTRRDMHVPDSKRKHQKQQMNTAQERTLFDENFIKPLLKTQPPASGSAAAAAAGPSSTSSTSPTLASFQQCRTSFLNGSMDASSFLDELDQNLLLSPLTKGDSQGLPCSSFATILHSLQGPPPPSNAKDTKDTGIDTDDDNSDEHHQRDHERESTLHGAYLKRFPDVISLCCKVRHCFRCHIKGYHDGKSCEQYQASKATVEDVVPCPKCGIQLTKGDGCNSVNCVCGRGFSWSTELEKLQKNLGQAFETQVAEALLCRLPLPAATAIVNEEEASSTTTDTTSSLMFSTISAPAAAAAVEARAAVEAAVKAAAANAPAAAAARAAVEAAAKAAEARAAIRQAAFKEEMVANAAALLAYNTFAPLPPRAPFGATKPLALPPLLHPLRFLLVHNDGGGQGGHNLGLLSGSGAGMLESWSSAAEALCLELGLGSSSHGGGGSSSGGSSSSSSFDGGGASMRAAAWAKFHSKAMTPAKARLFEAVAGGSLPIAVNRTVALTAAAFTLVHPPPPSFLSPSPPPPPPPPLPPLFLPLPPQQQACVPAVIRDVALATAWVSARAAAAAAGLFLEARKHCVAKAQSAVTIPTTQRSVLESESSSWIALHHHHSTFSTSSSTSSSTSDFTAACDGGGGLPLAAAKAVDVFDRRQSTNTNQHHQQQLSSSSSSDVVVENTYEKLAMAFGSTHGAEVEAERAKRFEALAAQAMLAESQSQTLSLLKKVKHKPMTAAGAGAAAGAGVDARGKEGLGGGGVGFYRVGVFELLAGADDDDNTNVDAAALLSVRFELRRLLVAAALPRECLEEEQEEEEEENLQEEIGCTTTTTLSASPCSDVTTTMVPPLMERRQAQLTNELIKRRRRRRPTQAQLTNEFAWRTGRGAGQARNSNTKSDSYSSTNSSSTSSSVMPSESRIQAAQALRLETLAVVRLKSKHTEVQQHGDDQPAVASSAAVSLVLDHEDGLLPLSPHRYDDYDDNGGGSTNTSNFDSLSRHSSHSRRSSQERKVFEVDVGQCKKGWMLMMAAVENDDGGGGGGDKKKKTATTTNLMLLNEGRALRERLRSEAFEKEVLLDYHGQRNNKRGGAEAAATAGDAAAAAPTGPLFRYLWMNESSGSGSSSNSGSLFTAESDAVALVALLRSKQQQQQQPSPSPAMINLSNLAQSALNAATTATAIASTSTGAAAPAGAGGAASSASGGSASGGSADKGDVGVKAEEVAVGVVASSSSSSSSSSSRLVLCLTDPSSFASPWEQREASLMAAAWVSLHPIAAERAKMIERWVAVSLAPNAAAGLAAANAAEAGAPPPPWASSRNGGGSSSSHSSPSLSPTSSSPSRQQQQRLIAPIPPHEELVQWYKKRSCAWRCAKCCEEFETPSEFYCHQGMNQCLKA